MVFLKLAQLGFIELVSELEDRSLETDGTEEEMMERLRQALIEEGKNPEVYEFDIVDAATLEARCDKLISDLQDCCHKYTSLQRTTDLAFQELSEELDEVWARERREINEALKLLDEKIRRTDET